VQAGTSCTPLLGIPIMTTIAEVASWRVAFLAVALFGVGVVPLLWWAVGSETSRPTAAATGPSPVRLTGTLAAYAPLVRHRPTLGLIGATMLGNAALWTVLSYLGAFYVERHGFTIQGAGLATIPPGIALVVGSLAAGGRLGGVPLRPLIAGARALAALLLGGALALPLPVGLVVTLLALNAGLMGVTLVATTLLLTGESPAGRATTLTLNGSGNSLGIALGGALGGLLLALGDYPALGLGALALAGSSAALAWWSRDRPLPESVTATPPATS
jgi:predicted MFS family arabinose efflux permease